MATYLPSWGELVHNRHVHLWRITRDRKRDLEQHEVEPGFGHALLSPVVASVFESLRLAAGLWEHGFEWKVLHQETTLAAFEIEHGKADERYRYNGECGERAMASRRILLGRHHGLCDLFAPVIARGQVIAVLVTGSFWTARPKTEEIVARWRWLSERQAHPADPEFSSYLAATLSTLVLDASGVRALEKLLGCLVRLMVGEGAADAIANEAEALRAELEAARFTERAWHAAREMVDERSARQWGSSGHVASLRRIGLPGVPEAVLVGLCATREFSADPVDEAVRRHEFQRACVDLARRSEGVLAGRVGDHGVMFLLGGAGSLRRKRQRLTDLAERAHGMARQRFGLSVHFGFSVGKTDEPLPAIFQEALSASEAALVRDQKLGTADAGAASAGKALRQMRREFGAVVRASPIQLLPRFERYLEAVAAQSGHRIELARGLLEAGFERIAEPLLDSGTLDEKSYEDLCTTLDRLSGEARTLLELFDAYRRAVRDAVEAVRNPSEAHADRSLRRALDYIHRHYAEPLYLERVARVAGFNADYFSRLFKRRERITFEQYVRRLRVERAKQLLAGTELDVASVGELTGFGTPQYFCRAFRRETRVSPSSFRKTALRDALARPSASPRAARRPHT